VEWCEGIEADESRVDDLTNLTGRHLTQFKNWRGEDISKVTLRTNLSALRTFLRFCVSIDAVEPAIPEKLNVPTLDSGENHNTEHLTVDEANEILDYLSTFEYASMDHVLFKLQWTTSTRMSGLHSLDVDDFDFDERTLRIEHRPEKGTRLKNSALHV